MQFWGHSPLIFSSLAHSQSFKLCPPSLWRHPLQLLCLQMKGSIDVENCCLVISYIPLSRISAVLLLHLRDTAEKSGLKFHRWRGRLRRNKSGFNTTNISNYQMWAEKHKKTRRDRKALGILQSFPLGMKVPLWGFPGRKPRQPAHLDCISGPWTGGEAGWMSLRCFPQSIVVKAHSNLPA